jgi:hypothetical protein
MADGTAGRNYEGFIPLNEACARVHRAITGRGPHVAETTQFDSVALSLCVVARIYATDPLTNLLFPVSEAELLLGNFQGGAKHFVCNGSERYTGLHVALADLKDAIRLLTAARMERPHDPTPKRGDSDSYP